MVSLYAVPEYMHCTCLYHVERDSQLHNGKDVFSIVLHIHNSDFRSDIRKCVVFFFFDNPNASIYLL